MANSAFAIPRSLDFQRVPMKAVLITGLASALALGWAVLDDLPLYAIVGLAVLPWIPLFTFEAAWKYENYGFYALLGVFTILQIGHLGEHTAQVLQLLIHDGDLFKAHGVFGALDRELVHFTWDSGVWVGLLASIYVLGFGNRWLIISLIFASLHEMEHVFLFYIDRFHTEFYDNGGLTGILAKGGVLGSPLSRPYMHYIYNYFVVIPLMMAFWDETKRAYSVWLDKALPDLTEQEKVSVSKQLDRVAVNEGDVIVRQGEIADRFYIVADGEVEVLRETDGREERVAVLGPGQFFGEIGLLTGKARIATVRATKDTELLALDRDEFTALVTRSHGGAADLDAAMHRRMAELGTGPPPRPAPGTSAS
jgi:hypothetical protein